MLRRMSVTHSSMLIPVYHGAGRGIVISVIVRHWNRFLPQGFDSQESSTRSETLNESAAYRRTSEPLPVPVYDATTQGMAKCHRQEEQAKLTYCHAGNEVTLLVATLAV